jgi:hypothetical protein
VARFLMALAAAMRQAVVAQKTRGGSDACR